MVPTLRRCAYSRTANGVLVTLLPPSAIPIRSLARPRIRLPRVPPPVLYPVRHWRWSPSSLSSAYTAYAAVLKLRNDDTGEHRGVESLLPRPIEPAFCCHVASRMQQAHRLEALPPRHFPCTFGVHVRTCCCMLDYIYATVEFMSQLEYRDLIPMFSIVNEGVCHLEPRNSNTDPTLQSASPALDATSSPPSRNIIRGITGNGPFIRIGFQGTTWWTGFPPWLGPHYLRHASILCVCNVPTEFHYLIGPLYMLTLLYNFSLQRHDGLTGTGRSGTGLRTLVWLGPTCVWTVSRCTAQRSYH